MGWFFEKQKEQAGNYLYLAEIRYVLNNEILDITRIVTGRNEQNAMEKVEKWFAERCMDKNVRLISVVLHPAII